MEKVKAKITINDYIIENQGIIDNEILTVNDNETKLSYDYKNNTLRRENNEYIIILDFESKKVTYNLKEVNNEFSNKFTILTRLMMTSMMSECAKSFERLPIILHADILRNIIYSGVWTQYEYIQLKKKKRTK